MRIDRETSFAGRRDGVTTAVARPQLRWTRVTGPDGRPRMEMRWDAGQPARPFAAQPAA